MGAQARLGAAAPNHGVGTDMIDAVLAHGVRLDGDLAHMGEGLLRQLTVRARKN